MNKKMIYNFGVKQFIEATQQWKLFAYVTTDQRKDATIVLSSLKTPFSQEAVMKDNFKDASKDINRPKSV
jgi:hypothetical protein